MDGREIGRLLGQAAASQAPGDVPVYLFCRGLDYGDSAQVYEGVRTVLDEKGYHYRLIEKKTRTHSVRPYRRQTLPEAAGLPL